MSDKIYEIDITERAYAKVYVRANSPSEAALKLEDGMCYDAKVSDHISDELQKGFAGWDFSEPIETTDDVEVDIQ